jgi:hypothetical protein
LICINNGRPAKTYRPAMAFTPLEARMRKLGIILGAAILSMAVAASPALADGGHGGGGGGWHGGGGGGWHGGGGHDGHWHGGGWHGGVYFGVGPYWGWGPGWWGYPYAYGYPYPYAYPAPAYVAPAPYAYPAAPAPTAPAASVWYYCESSRAYYPYVQSCQEGWRQVPAQPTH